MNSMDRKMSVATTTDDDDDEKMGLSRCGNFLKYTMFLFNAVILIAGCGLLGFGVYLWTQQDSKIPQLAFLGSHYYQLLTLALIISGGVVIILSFFGCCGAIKEVKCMLTIFFLMLCVMLTSMIVGGVVAFVYKDTLEEVILETMTSSLNSSYGIVGHEEVTQTWDIIQTVLQCCGVFGGVNSTTSWAYYKHYSLWYTNKTEDAIHVFVPESCCKFGDLEPNRTICQTGRQDPEDMLRIPADVTVTEDTFNDNLFTDGCYTAVIDELKDKSQVLAIAFAVIGVLMMMGIVFSICLCRRINDEFIFD